MDRFTYKVQKNCVSGINSKLVLFVVTLLVEHSKVNKRACFLSQYWVVAAVVSVEMSFQTSLLQTNALATSAGFSPLEGAATLLQDSEFKMYLLLLLIVNYDQILEQWLPTKGVIPAWGTTKSAERAQGLVQFDGFVTKDIRKTMVK